MRRFVTVFVVCAGIYFLLFQAFRMFTDVSGLEKNYPHYSYDRKTKTATMEILKNRPAGWTNLGAISPLAVSAIVLSEDWAFYQHNGFDWEQIWDAFQKNLEQGRFARGGSTITQQVVKNVFLSNQKTIWRKVNEAVLAVRIERQLTKKRILEIYLNIAEFGEGTYGIGPAARLYFNKSPGELTAKEGAFLAMLLPSPKKYSVSFRQKGMTRYASSTVRSILGKLQATKRLSEEEYQAALATPLSFERVPEPVVTSGAPSDEEVTDAFSGGDDDQGAAGAGTTGAGNESRAGGEGAAPEPGPAAEVEVEAGSEP